MPISARRHSLAELDDGDRLVCRVDREPRDERDAHARGDQRLHGPVVVGAEDDVRLLPDEAQPLLDAPRRPAGAVADQRQLEDLAQRRRLVPRRERRVGGDDEHVRVAHQLDRLERARLERETQKLRSTSPRSTSPSSSRSSVDSTSGCRPSAIRRGSSRAAGEDARADGLVRADAQRPGVAGGERLEVGLGRLQARRDALRVAEQQPAGLGQRDRPRPARAVDQALADDALEGGDLLADRRLRVAEACAARPNEPSLATALSATR